MSGGMFTLALAQIRVEQGRMAENLGRAEARIAEAAAAGADVVLLPEALEVWPVTFFERILPRHLLPFYHHFRRIARRMAPSYLRRFRRKSERTTLTAPRSP